MREQRARGDRPGRHRRRRARLAGLGRPGADVQCRSVDDVSVAAQVMSRVKLTRSHRRAASHLSGLKKDEYTGLWCCWVCARPMDSVLYASGFASHPDCDPGEVSERFKPETEPAWLRMQ